MGRTAIRPIWLHGVSVDRVLMQNHVRDLTPSVDVAPAGRAAPGVGAGRARRRDILIQFLVEAVALSLLGGIGGVLLTGVLINGGAIAAQTVLQQPDLARFITLDRSAVVLALLFSSAVGLIAGSYPAFRASRLTPINALRSE
ncbi:ABC transporter permease [Oscillochloris sp. ZM17-4]|uniref:ABC transporter permease n=1 Tax=Oscillochloris sp. ZM17-4 TaxID=2866714 RepID=UPI001C7392D2|nr:ABC transporter permease [Oscillochloris sp. ZM17-4]MBX0328456.1 ABC transporter permease [Oscillochloris sp. ZM17-4]